MVATARPYMNVSAFIESVVAAAQSPNHHDDQLYFNFNESVRCQSFNLNLKLSPRLPLRGLHSECVFI